ncbi:hypothetical protein C206_06919 [Pseudomonas putida TRO1]|uniref:Double-GTPase 1 domain-containing protein n=1 Tax=Pseudomonas putida TRO1 TaxID=1227924 RepID=A0AAD2WCW1_PSEPU|nr:hypothetical protein [Pseudomonas putida]ENY78518.1 hypothetical protein C206_06919 [Pseudomonas putida TRO1]
MNANFVIMGLPASGKTTFLAALWHLIESEETDCRLTMDDYKGDLVYLRLISAAWRTFKEVPRTSQVGNTDVVIYLKDRESGARGTALFPDLAGETFELQVEERKCRPEFIEQASADDGVLFFVNANLKEDGLTINELNSRIPEIDTTANPGNATQKASTDILQHREWEPKLAPAQVKIVQLLSDFIRPPFTFRRRRLALMVSAWDLARDQHLTPDAWLATNMPLVDQFLKSNPGLFEHRVYGVSAQGVKLDDDNAVEKIAEIIPSKRIQIVGPDIDANGHDLTCPLVWLMSAAV